MLRDRRQNEDVVEIDAAEKLGSGKVSETSDSVVDPLTHNEDHLAPLTLDLSGGDKVRHHKPNGRRQADLVARALQEATQSVFHFLAGKDRFFRIKPMPALV